MDIWQPCLRPACPRRKAIICGRTSGRRTWATPEALARMGQRLDFARADTRFIEISKKPIQIRRRSRGGRMGRNMARNFLVIDPGERPEGFRGFASPVRVRS